MNPKSQNFQKISSTISSTNSRIQDLDGGFFERFGSLLQQAESKHEEVVLAAMPQNDAMPFENLDDGGDSGVEIAADSDSEQDTEQMKAEKSVDFIETAVGWNVSTKTHPLFVLSSKYE